MTHGSRGRATNPRSTISNEAGLPARQPIGSAEHQASLVRWAGRPISTWWLDPGGLQAPITRHPYPSRLTSIRASDRRLGLAPAHGLHPRVVCGLFDGLAHELWRHGVQPVGVVVPGHPGRSQTPWSRPHRAARPEAPFQIRAQSVELPSGLQPQRRAGCLLAQQRLYVRAVGVLGRIGERDLHHGARIRDRLRAHGVGVRLVLDLAVGVWRAAADTSRRARRTSTARRCRHPPARPTRGWIRRSRLGAGSPILISSTSVRCCKVLPAIASPSPQTSMPARRTR
jgi:hypothetical protein